MTDTTLMLHYPHGWNEGGVEMTDICPSITISGWQANHFIIEIYEPTARNT